MKHSNPVERKTLKEMGVNRLKDDGLNIPLYANDVFNEEIKRMEYKNQKEKEYEEYQKMKEQKEKEKREERNKLIKINEMNQYLLSICAIMIILGITSICLGSFLNAIYSVIGILSTLYIGRRLKFNFDEVSNILLWNITQTLNDIIEYKIPYDIKGSYKNIVNKASFIMMISLLFLNSNNIIYGLSLFILILGFLMSLSFRDFKVITSKLNKLIICSIIGLFFKTILSFFILKVFTIDFFNVVLVNIFTMINLLKDIELEEPKE